jgi:hypothetical protein
MVMSAFGDAKKTPPPSSPSPYDPVVASAFADGKVAATSGDGKQMPRAPARPQSLARKRGLVEEPAAADEPAPPSPFHYYAD